MFNHGVLNLEYFKQGSRHTIIIIIVLKIWYQSKYKNLVVCTIYLVENKDIDNSDKELVF